MNRLSGIISLAVLTFCLGLLGTLELFAQAQNPFKRRSENKDVIVANPPAPELSTTIVISQAYGGGGGTTGTYLNDYVELKNISSSPQSLNGLSLMYGSATGQFGSSATNIFALPNVTLQAGQYFLVQLSNAGTGGVPLPVTPDASTTNLSMSGTNGKVALTNGLAPNSCGATATPCTLPNAQIIDLVAWGTSNNAEGGASTNGGAALTSVQGNVRKTNGCTETDNNNADFDIITAPVPRNTATTAAPCSGPPASPAKLFKAYLNGANETTPNASPATGFGRVSLNDAETQITASFYFANLTSATTDGHIHGPAGPGTNAPVIFGMTPPLGVTSGSAVDRVFAVTPAQVADLKAGLWYFNIHTSNFPGGEIRGQILIAKPPIDMEGDGRTDYVVLRDSNGPSPGGFIQWFTSLNSTGAMSQAEWGIYDTVNEEPVPADYDGDGKVDLTVTRDDTISGLKTFYVLLSATNSFYVDQLGLNNDEPVAGDYNGDGRADPAVYRSNGNGTSNWYYRPSLASGFVTIVHNGDGSRAGGDYDGDGKHDPATFDDVGGGIGQFKVTRSTGGTLTANIGLATDRVAPGDFDGDGKTDFCVIRADGAVWRWDYGLNVAGGGPVVSDTWGLVASDMPVTGDYNGDGKADYAVWRNGALAEFYAMTPVTRLIYVRQWGISSDYPLAAINVSGN